MVVFSLELELLYGLDNNFRKVLLPVESVLKSKSLASELAVAPYPKLSIYWVESSG